MSSGKEMGEQIKYKLLKEHNCCKIKPRIFYILLQVTFVIKLPAWWFGIYDNFSKSGFEIIKYAWKSWFCHKRQYFGLSGERFFYLAIHTDISILFLWPWEVYLSSEMISKSNMHEKVIAIQWDADNKETQPKPSENPLVELIITFQSSEHSVSRIYLTLVSKGIRALLQKVYAQFL